MSSCLSLSAGAAVTVRPVTVRRTRRVQVQAVASK